MHNRLGRHALVLLALSLLAASGASEATARFRPRIGRAMGLIAPYGHRDLASAPPVPVVYHGGAVMTPPVTVHTVFWAPPGHPFSGSPGLLVPGYEALAQRFFRDVAHDSGTVANVFSVLGEYPQARAPSGYGISYDPATDSIHDTTPYPGAAAQCPSPSGAATCVTDTELTHELDRLIAARAPAARGLHDVWIVFLPPGVDECTDVGSCGTNSYAGYHSLFDYGAGPTVYAVILDPLLEAPTPAGNDPTGNPEAETALDTAAHELVEAITDPEGPGWLDPNGFEVGDKCENGPQFGTPLGYAPNGSPFNQRIAGERYLIQAMWSNAALGCVQSSAASTSALPLAAVSMRQFSSRISGDIGRRRAGVGVAVELLRAGQPVGGALAHTRADGRWGPVSLQTASGGAAPAFGDDRDVVVVVYGKGGPHADEILTGSGGDPFSQSGFTGWYDLDTGYRVDRHYVLIAPCSQVGVLGLRVDGRATAPPIILCGTESGVAHVPTRRLGPGSRLSFTSLDNRAPSAANPSGALISLTVPLGEPGSVAAARNDQVLLLPGGFPACTVDLRAQRVQCSGLVPGERYRLVRRRARGVLAVRAGFDGVASFGRPGAPALTGGDVLSLRNPVGRTLTVLHVAHLRVAIAGRQTVLSGGRCEPGAYYGRPLQTQPTSRAVGDGGVSGNGLTCPGDGRAAGLPAAPIEQTDDRSGGLTRTSVALLEGTSPANDATVYGAFTALAQTGLPTATRGVYAGGAPVSLTVRPADARRIVFRAANVDTAQGVRVPALPAGVYAAQWVVGDANGDTRMVKTRFISAG